ncbi:MAG TPA: hypothetical protein VHX44_17975, partial [Planctomycetota bacterium]|nr:hypothetical protein [Planctomycetota bacterium]
GNTARPMPPENLLEQPPRRRRWWRILLVLVLLVIVAVVGGGWWALSINQTGNVISHFFAKRLPGRLEIDKTEFTGLDGLVLTGVRLVERSGAVPAVTVQRVVVSGELWKGEVERIRVEGLRLDATVDAVRFLVRLIKAENDIPGGPNPSPIKLEFTGGVWVNGEVAIDNAQCSVAATGAQIAVTGNARYGGAPVAVQIDTIGSGDQRTYRITLLEGKLPIWRSCDWLSALKLLPPLPQETHPWVPEQADAAGTVVIADKKWEHFTGEAKARWNTGRGQGDLQVDDRFVRLSRVVVRDDGLGSFDGQAMIDTDERRIAISATSWSPGPRVPIPAIVPTKSILAAMPRAQLDGALKDGAWDLALHLSGTGKATLAWAEGGSPLRIDGRGIALPLLQPFLPDELTLAAGNANSLNVEVGGDGLHFVSATVEQARVLWQGWALGSLDGRVGLKVVPAGIDLDVSLPAIGKATWRAAPQGGRIGLELTSAEALVVRLKGPQALPKLSGSAMLDAQVRRRDDASLVADIDRLRLDSLGITDVLRTLDTDLSSTVRLHAKRLDTHLLGRITSGELRIPGGWRDLAKRRPKFNAEASISNGVLLADNILVRATDATGEALIDGYSAGLRGRFSFLDATGTIIGVVDHADLGWINTLIPIPDGVVGGEGAVTFTANLMRDGIESVEGHFLPLDANLHIGQALTATGIKGAVKFRIARPGGTTIPSPK